MKFVGVCLAIFLALFLVAPNAFAWQRLKAMTFAKLPDGFIF